MPTLLGRISSIATSTLRTKTPFRTTSLLPLKSSVVSALSSRRSPQNPQAILFQNSMKRRTMISKPDYDENTGYQPPRGFADLNLDLQEEDKLGPTTKARIQSLFKAAYQGDHKAINSFHCYWGSIAISEIINHKNDSNETPLFIAAKNGHVKVVKELHYYGAKINLRSNNGCTALFYAAHNKHWDVVSFFLGKNLKPCWNTVHDVACYGPSHLFNRLACYMEYGKEAWTQILSKQLSKCNRDIEYVEFDIIKTCIEKGADVNFVLSNGETALIKGVKTGDDAIVTLLLQSCDKSMIDAFDCYGKTALTWACERSKFAIVKLLVENGAEINIDIKNERMEMLPVFFVVRNNDLEIFDYLLKKGLRVKNANENNAKAMVHVLKWADKEILNRLEQLEQTEVLALDQTVEPKIVTKRPAP